MNELLSDKLWTTIKRLAKKSSAKRAAVAYITTETFVEFGDGDILVTDATDHAIASGQTSARILSRAHKRGAEIFSVVGLHTKVLVLDGIAVIGSANLSESSANSLVEAAWVTDDPAAVGMTTSLIKQLTVQAEPVDASFLKRILKIKVKARLWPKGKLASKKIKMPKYQVWIIGVQELAKEFPDEQQAIEAGTAVAEQKVTQESSDVSPIRWTGNSRFRSDAKDGDTVIQIWRPAGAKTPKTVYRHAPILHRQNETKCTRFFVEDFTDAEDTSITWGKFKQLVKRVRLPGKIGPNSARPITVPHSLALRTLWEN